MGQEATAPAAFGRYQLERRIARDFLTETFLATLGPRTDASTEVVVRRVLPHLAADSAFASAFITETQQVAGLEHYGIGNIVEVGETDGLPFFATELVPGPTVDRILSWLHGGADSKLPFKLLASMLAECAKALDHAHNAGVRHGGLIPSDIAMTPNGTAKVFGFGLSRAVAASLAIPVGHMRARLPYSAPELLMGEGTERSDREAGPRP